MERRVGMLATFVDSAIIVGVGVLSMIVDIGFVTSGVIRRHILLQVRGESALGTARDGNKGITTFNVTAF